eukprot:6006213-Lingulodinium_polyedra.AAC.1
MWFASRCASEASIRPRHCAALHERCATTRANRCSVGATARKPRAGAPHARAKPGAPVERSSVRSASLWWWW